MSSTKNLQAPFGCLSRNFCKNFTTRRFTFITYLPPRISAQVRRESLRESSRKEFRVLNERRRLRRLGDHHPPTKEQGDYEYIAGAITRAMRRDATLYVATTPTPTPTMTTKTMTMSRTRVCCTRDKGSLPSLRIITLPLPATLPPPPHIVIIRVSTDKQTNKG